jgi:hypothetical protein
VTEPRRGRTKFEDFEASIRRVQSRAPLIETEEHARIREAAATLTDLPTLDRNAVATLLGAERGISQDMLRTLGLAIGLSHERLKNELRAHLSAEDRRRPERVAAFLDEEFGLIEEIGADRSRGYDWADILIARAGSRGTAGRAITGGRIIEDAIEGVVKALELPYALRTRFQGRTVEGPCDIAIPEGGAGAEIVCAAKGFDSTGSKLSDAVREISEMASIRKPTQFVLAVIDGIGWHGRRADLRRIYSLYESGQIDGLYTLGMLGQFQEDVDRAATLRGISRSSRQG